MSFYSMAGAGNVSAKLCSRSPDGQEFEGQNNRWPESSRG
jgi:hypothetical protein